MKSLLVDLAGHQSWADAEYWRAILNCAPATDDDAIRKRLHHLHQTQRAFLWLVEGETRPAFKTTTPQDFSSIADLREYAKASMSQTAAAFHCLRHSRRGGRIRSDLTVKVFKLLAETDVIGNQAANRRPNIPSNRPWISVARRSPR